ncbi:hypothetical protein E0H80_00085 [Acinetobacter sp. ANC 4779]|uniref:RcnB family protein n=1 Tax=Acinetobacter sp. ANC 4779 TaxID=2529848 RepID=UPI0010390F90|nr:RcnB family protein [Acinetobacter sp. ANC 4779]TCB52319.1 hypothetical protein E0H80_00085 [Acinetobacter sp. ANC 4779]
MNTLIKAIVLSVSASVMAASAFAAPQDNHNQPKQVNQHKKQPVVQKAQAQKHIVKPSSDWKAGQFIPSQYRKGYSLDHNKYIKLTKPAKNQQWVKVNNDYVLINTVNHQIVKIMKG